MAGIDKLLSMKSSAYEKWLNSFIELLKKEGHGTQSRIARQTGKSIKHISDIVTGRRRASVDLQEKIAEIMGSSYGEMLQLEIVKEAKGPFPKYADLMVLSLEDRAWAIVKMAAEKHGVIGFMSLGEARKDKEKPLLIKEFLKGELNEEGFYIKACGFFAGVEGMVHVELSKQGF